MKVCNKIKLIKFEIFIMWIQRSLILRLPGLISYRDLFFLFHVLSISLRVFSNIDQEYLTYFWNTYFVAAFVKTLYCHLTPQQVYF